MSTRITAVIFFVGIVCALASFYLGVATQKSQHEKEMLECAEELAGPNMCGKIWNYATSLEDENARINKLLDECLDDE